MIILCESTYDQKLNDQILKRAHCFNQQRIVIYYILRNNTVIEELIEQKRKNKFNFEEKIFIKMQKKNEKNIIAEDDIKTNFVEGASTVILKIN